VLNVLCTTVEAAGLVLVIAVGIPYWGSVSLWENAVRHGDIGLSFLMTGAILTFFRLHRLRGHAETSPRIARSARHAADRDRGAMIAATVLYMAVAVTAVSSCPGASSRRRPARSPR
jgi:hypothetical protein